MPALNGDAGFCPIGGIWGDADLGDGNEKKDGKKKEKRSNCGAIGRSTFVEGLWMKPVFGKKKEESGFEGEEEQKPQKRTHPFVIWQETFWVEITQEKQKQAKG